MKTYCKPKTVNIESAEFNSTAVHLGFSGKLGKREFQELLLATGKITRAELREEIRNNSCMKILGAIDVIAEELTRRIQDRNLQLQPVISFQRRDGISQKLRDLNKETAEQQLYEYMAHHALEPLFRAKLLPCQCGSIPGKGQIGGKRQLERILRKKFHCDKLDEAKCDVRHAYQSVTVECVMMLLRRDIGKNKPLLWFIEACMSNYPDGRLMIGGYLPTWLFNYVMSYVLRYLLAQYKSRRGVRHNMVWAIVCYADDFSCFGKWSNLRRAIKATTAWCKQTLGVEIKGCWNISRIASFEEEKKQYAARKAGSHARTPGIDMVGYVVRRTYTIVRGKIFVRVRRQLIRAQRNLDTLGYVPWWRAYKISAYYGWLKTSDSQKMRKKYGVKYILKKSKQSVSMISKARIKEEQERERILCGMPC